MRLLCALPMVFFRHHEVTMASRYIPRRTMPHFVGFFLLTIRRSLWSRGRRQRPPARRQRLSSSVATISAKFRPVGDAHNEFSAGCELIWAAH